MSLGKIQVFTTHDRTYEIYLTDGRCTVFRGEVSVNKKCSSTY